MTLETFKEVILLLKKESEKINKLHKLGIDLYEFNDELQKIIYMLIKSHYSEEGEDVFSWWLWEDGVEKKTFDKDGNVLDDLTKVEDLWKYLEEKRKSSDFKEYSFIKKKKLSKKQLDKMFKKMFE